MHLQTPVVLDLIYVQSMATSHYASCFFSHTKKQPRRDEGYNRSKAKCRNTILLGTLHPFQKPLLQIEKALLPLHVIFRDFKVLQVC